MPSGQNKFLLNRRKFISSSSMALAAIAGTSVVGTSRLAWARPAPNTAPTQSKAAGLYMICTLSKHDAEAAGYEDALMLDWRGQIAEATGANVFLAIDGELHTPKPDCFLDGITRRTVMGFARNRQIKVHERAIMPDELGRAQEVFLTGTAAEITPVREVDQYRFTPGAITKTLMEDFDKAVGRG